MNLWKEFQHQFKTGNNLTRVLLINVGIFVAFHIIRFLSWLLTGTGESGITDFVMSNLETYLNVSVLATKPWTIVTYMFFHIGFMHLLSNMLILFWMGRIFVDMLNDKKFLAVYVLGGICGAVLSTLAYNTIPVLQDSIASGSSVPMLGASAAVLAVTAAVGTYFPDYKIYLLFFGRVSLKYFALAVVGLSVLFIPDGNAGGQIAHLGGALFGFVWASQLRKGNDIAKWFMSLVEKIQNLFKPKSKLKVSYKNTRFSSKRKRAKEATYVDYEEVSEKDSNQKELDVILDKIAKYGYESLTKAEKEKLFTSSNKKK